MGLGARLRQDYGDIEALAESIERVGLLQPIVIDAQQNLVCGGRRLRACRSLGWTLIDAVVLGTLDDEERGLHELEENVQRLDLTAAERSRAYRAIREAGERVIAARQQTSAKDWPKPAHRPPARGASGAAVARETGVPRQTLELGTKHADAVDRYPALEP